MRATALLRLPAFVAGGVLASALAANNPAGTPATSPARRPARVLSSSILPLAATRHVIRRAELTRIESEATVRFSVSLRMRNYAEFTARVHNGERIAAAEMEARYLPLRSQYDALATWLAAQGFTISFRDQFHTEIGVEGSVEQTARALAVTFARVADGDAEYTTAITAPALPEEFVDSVIGIDGLQPHLHPIPQGVAPPFPQGDAPLTNIAQLAAAVYKIPAALNGAGQTIAIVGQGQVLDSDLSQFWNTYGVTRGAATITRVAVNGGGSATLNSGSYASEDTMDVSMATALAPAAKVRLYEAPSVTTCYTQVLNDHASDPTITVMSVSYGTDHESSVSSASLQSQSQTLAQLANAGVTVLISSGDGGTNPTRPPGGSAAYDPTTPLAVGYPASDPSVTSAGGSVIDKFGNEAGWSASLPRGGVQYGGGGYSTLFPAPSWQKVTPWGANAPTTKRAIPDICAPALNCQYIFNGAARGAGGTSESAPVLAGVVALLNQARASAGLGSLGLLGPVMYPLQGTAAFNDVVTGGNNGLYPAGPGYDLVTGLGSPNVTVLASVLTGGAYVAVTPAAAVVRSGDSALFSASIPASTTGTFQWQMLQADGSWANLAEGGKFSGTTSATLRVTNVTADLSSAQVQVVATIGGVAVTSAPANLILGAAPTGSVAMSSSLATTGSTAWFAVAASSPSGGTTYQWRLNGAAIAGATSFVYGVSSASDTAAGSYTVDLGNTFGSTSVAVGKLAVTPAYRTLTVAGAAGGPASSDGPAASARFAYPQGVAVDGSGNIYVADTANSTIRKIGADGTVSTLAGKPGANGTSDGTGAAARFNRPTALALDAAGNIYVADTANSSIRKITPAGAVTTFAGSSGRTGTTDAVGTAARFTYPAGLAVGSDGNLYVADTFNHTIRKVTPTGVVTTYAGTALTSGSTNATGAAARFRFPAGLAADSQGNLFVAEPRNHDVRQIASGGVVTTVAGSTSTYGTADGTGSSGHFFLPNALAVDASGNIYVADTGNNTIRKVTPSGTVTTFAGTGGTAGNTDGTGSAARFNAPMGIAVDRNGTVYVADMYSQTIRTITPAGAVSLFAGSAGPAGTIDGAGSVAQLNFPTGIAADGKGNIYVSDTASNVIRVVNAAGTVSTLAGLAGVAGRTDGVGSGARFNRPTGVALGADGNVYVADTNNFAIRKITPAGSVSTFAGGGSSGGLSGSADGTGTSATFNLPMGLAADSAGNLYVADTANHDVRKITSAAVVTTLAGAPGSFGTSDGTGSSARFLWPMGVAVDANGNVFVADTLSDRIRLITPAGVVTSLAGATEQLGTTDGFGSAARFDQPVGIAVDANGTIFVADSNNGTIRTISPTGVVATLLGTAATAGSGDGTGSLAAFNGPRALTIDTAGTLYVADAANDLARVAFAPVTSAPAAAGIAAGSTATFTAPSLPSFSYQWQLNGATIAGASNASYVIPAVSQNNAGNYSVVLSNSRGSNSLTVGALSISTGTGTGVAGRLVNMSIRTNAGIGDSTLIVGVALGGAGTSGSKALLVRAVGPTLASFGVPGALADPALTAYQGTTIVAQNDDWSGGFDFGSVGAFPLAGPAPKDAAIYNPSFALGSYSIQITGKGSGTGIALAEIYDATPSTAVTAATARLINVSARTQVGTGDNVLIAGFAVGGSGTMRVLIRAAGPSLTTFGVAGALNNPKLEVYNGSIKISENDDWGGTSDLKAAFASVGAFGFASDSSRDAAAVVVLGPGSYTAQVSGVGGTTGVSLVEVYELP